MREKNKRWASFAIGLLLGAGGTTGAILAADCSPSVKITQAVVDAYCIGREPHVCPSPCPTGWTCPDPCAAPPAACDEPTIEVVPTDWESTPPDGWGEEGEDWIWVEADQVGAFKLAVDWSVVTAPDFDQAAAAFAFRWKEDQAWRPIISGSWTRGASGSESESCADVGWSSYLDCSTTTILPVDDNWSVLLGVGGTFGK